VGVDKEMMLLTWYNAFYLDSGDEVSSVNIKRTKVKAEVNDAV
jgi:hypothetical protein